MLQAHGGADLRADPQTEHQRLYLKLLGVDVYELAKADAEAEEKEHAPKRHKASGSQNDPICWRGEEGGGSRAEGGWVVGWREEGRRELGSRDAVKERGGCREEGGERGGCRESSPPSPAHKMRDTSDTAWILDAQVFRTQILHSPSI